ncbi:MAG: hypothetical protein HYY96_03410 [Candidatus Tectomicrobia bacterium]|nr:hypothetical protein [Candidatus Tectomicrobia bacterium]
MPVTDYIQIVIAVVLTGTLVILAWQLVIQNRLLKAQVLDSRFQMYWKTYEPVSDAEVEQVNLYPEDYMSEERYQIYRENPTAIRKYLGLLSLYEYLAFSYSLKKLRLPDPLGYTWTERWAKDLLGYPEFLEVHNYHREYYPDFAKYIDSLVRVYGEVANPKVS